MEKNTVAVDQLRSALKSAELGRGSYHQNYDGNKLGHAIEELLKVASQPQIVPEAPDNSPDLLDAIEDAEREKATSEQPNSTECHPDAAHEPDKFDLALTEAGRIMAGGKMARCCDRAMSLGIPCSAHGFDPVYGRAAEGEAAPADLSNGAVWATIDAAMPLLAQHHCPALLALSKGDREIFARAILAKSRAAEEEATSERKPLTENEIAELADQHDLRNGIRPNGYDAETKFVRAIEQHHGIGSAK